MRKARQISGVLVNVSIVVAVWALLVFGWMNVAARQACIEHKFSRATVTPRYGTVCTAVFEGNEVTLPLSRILEYEAQYSE